MNDALKAEIARYEANLAGYEAGLALNEAEAAFLLNAYEMHQTYQQRVPCDALKAMMEALGQNPEEEAAKFADDKDVDITELSAAELAIFGKLMGRGLVELYGENNTFVRPSGTDRVPSMEYRSKPQPGKYAVLALQGEEHGLTKPAPPVPFEESGEADFMRSLGLEVRPTGQPKKTISVGRCWKPGRRRGGFDYEAAILAEGDRYWM